MIALNNMSMYIVRSMTIEHFGHLKDFLEIRKFIAFEIRTMQRNENRRSVDIFLHSSRFDVQMRTIRERMLHCAQYEFLKIQHFTATSCRIPLPLPNSHVFFM